MIAHLLRARHRAKHSLLSCLILAGVLWKRSSRPLGRGMPGGDHVSRGLEVGKPGVDFGKMSLDL